MPPQWLHSIPQIWANSAGEESNGLEINVVNWNRLVSPRVGDVVRDDGLASANNDMWLKVGVFCSSLCVDSRCILLVRSIWRV